MPGPTPVANKRYSVVASCILTFYLFSVVWMQVKNSKVQTHKYLRYHHFILGGLVASKAVLGTPHKLLSSFLPGTQTNREGSPTICLPAYTWQLHLILTFPVGITFPDGVVVHSYLFISNYKEILKNIDCFSSITLEPSSLCVLLLTVWCVSLVVRSRKGLAAPAVKV